MNGSRNSADADSAAEIRAALEDVLVRYLKAKTNETISKDHPICSQLASIAKQLSESTQVRRFPRVVVKWSAGQGNWATIPWIAALDSRETTRTSAGIYVVYLFRADMSGLYLTLNQGTTEVQAQYGRGAHAELRRRAVGLRRRATTLEAAGFDLSTPPSLRHNAAIVSGYEIATVAHKLYEREAIPNGARLLTDLEAVLAVYDRVVPSRAVLGEPPDPK